MASRTRSQASKRAWRTRKQERHPVCPFCGKPVFSQGVRRGNRTYHNECWDRSQIVKVRKSTAQRGFYAK